MKTEKKHGSEVENNLLSVCEMIKNVVHTRMELRKKKQKRGLKCVTKVARKLVKKGKLRKNASNKACGVHPKKYVIDLNLNVTINK